jgi:hypothetical protein
MRRIENERQRPAMRLAAPYYPRDLETRRHASPLHPSPRSPMLPRATVFHRIER